MRGKTLALMALALSLFASTSAHANPSRDQLRTAEKINAILNADREWSAIPLPCSAYATNKAYALVLAGIGGVTLAIVRDEHGQAHEVAEIRSGDQTTVYDSRFSRPMTRKDLEAFGYRWVFEFAANHTEESKP